MDTKQQIADLIKRVKQLEEKVFGLETMGKPSLLDLNLKQMRKNKGLTLRQVEEKTGVSNAYLSQLETGKIKSPGYDTVKCLIELYCNGGG